MLLCRGLLSVRLLAGLSVSPSASLSGFQSDEGFPDRSKLSIWGELLIGCCYRLLLIPSSRGRNECEEEEGKGRAFRRKCGGVGRGLCVPVLKGPLLGTR